jgi:hypothetical protein
MHTREEDILLLLKNVRSHISGVCSKASCLQTCIMYKTINQPATITVLHCIAKWLNCLVY